MVTSKIQNLTDDDLDYLYKLLNSEFSKQTNRSTSWKTKHGYNDPCDHTRQISRIMEAIRSQKKIMNMPKW